VTISKWLGITANLFKSRICSSSSLITKAGFGFKKGLGFSAPFSFSLFSEISFSARAGAKVSLN
jgi:hypothetical protein